MSGAIVSDADSWLANLAEHPGAARDYAVLDAVDHGVLRFDWYKITCESRAHRGEFLILEDAAYIQLSDGSRYRPMCSARLLQNIADHVGAMLMTSKLMDLRHEKATVRLRAHPLPASPDMATTTYSRRYNEVVEKERAGRTGLVSDAGKTWVLSPLLRQRANVACNYGFFDYAAPTTSHSGERLYQGRGTRHNSDHEDYSQLIHIVGAMAVVDGKSMATADVLKHADLHELISDEGPLSISRQPGV